MSTEVTTQVHLRNLAKTGWLGLKEKGYCEIGGADARYLVLFGLLIIPNCAVITECPGGITFIFILSSLEMESSQKIRWTNRWKDGQTDGWELSCFVGAVAFWSCVRLHAVNASLCHIWTVVSTSNNMMNRTEGEQRKDGGWISPCWSASCSYRQINICRHSSAIDSIHVRVDKW